LFKECFKNFDQAAEWINTRNITYNLLSKAGQAYAKHLEGRYNFVHIFGMNKPVPLRNIYIRINLLERITSRHRATVDELEHYFDRNRRSFGSPLGGIDAMHVINVLENYIILGKPGAGKTTFLKSVALQTLDGASQAKLVPIFVGLKDWSDSSLSLMDFIANQFAVCNLPDSHSFVESLLVQGKCLVLLDGFDEVSGDIDKAIIDIRQFINRYNTNPFILSCRIAAYNYWFENFIEAEIADFTEEQIKAFVVTWFGDDERTGVACLNELMENPPIKELASIPLLLTLLCLAFDETLRFPRNKAELYKEAIDALLKKWDTSRRIKRQEVYKKLSLKLKESMFSQIAATTFESSQYFLPQRTLEKHIADFIQHLPGTRDENLELDSEAVLKSIEAQHGLFVERAKGIYSFSHLTFQEYFTAKYIVDNAEHGTLSFLVEKHISEDRWREVFLITTGMLPRADSFLLHVKKKVDSIVDPQLASILNVLQYYISSRIQNVAFTFEDADLALICAFARSRALARACDYRSFPSFLRIHSEGIYGALKSSFEHELIRVQSFITEQKHRLATTVAEDLNLNLASERDYHLALEIAEDFGFGVLLDIAFDSEGAAKLSRELEMINAKTLEIYLKGNLLLADCLDSDSYISRDTRREILNTILVVPSHYS
jgi:hypothetical protein